MRTTRATIVFLVAAVLSHIRTDNALACWAAPPDVAWGAAKNGQFEFKRENKTGRITVYKVGDRENAMWQVSVPEFNGLFSRFVLADTGKMLVHVRGNHQVSKLSDTAVHVFQRHGMSCRIAANEFIDRLTVPANRSSITPAFMWMQGGAELTNQSLNIVNAAGKKKSITLKDLNRRLHPQPPEGDK